MWKCIALAVVLVTSGCSLTPMNPEPACKEPAAPVEEKQPRTVPAALGHVEPGTVLYVNVQTGSADGAILEKAHVWGRVLAKLKLNQCLTVLDWTISEVFAKVRDETSRQEGWCKKQILSNAPVASRCVTPADFEEFGVHVARFGKIYPHHIDEPLCSGNPRYKRAIEQVDTLEQAINQALGGHPGHPNYEAARRAFEEFGRAGGLIR